MVWINLYFRARRAAVKLYFKTRDYCLMGFAYLWTKTPWFKAIVRNALATYGESESYRLRCSEVDSIFAFRAFFEYGELSYWKWKAQQVRKINKWRLIFLPDTICQKEVAEMFAVSF